MPVQGPAAQPGWWRAGGLWSVHPQRLLPPHRTPCATTPAGEVGGPLLGTTPHILLLTSLARAPRLCTPVLVTQSTSSLKPRWASSLSAPLHPSLARVSAALCCLASVSLGLCLLFCLPTCSLCLHTCLPAPHSQISSVGASTCCSELMIPVRVPPPSTHPYLPLPHTSVPSANRTEDVAGWDRGSQQLLPARWLDRTLLEAPGVVGCRDPAPSTWADGAVPSADLARRGGGAAESSQAGACAPGCERARAPAHV